MYRRGCRDVEGMLVVSSVLKGSLEWRRYRRRLSIVKDVVRSGGGVGDRQIRREK